MKTSDFTVYDFQRNSKPLKGWQNEVKQIKGQPAESQIETVPDDWLEIDFDNSLTSTNTSASTGSMVTKKSDMHLENGGIVYPVDMWFLIGEYVNPEDISVFARICHGTHYVTHSARFWINIYHRYCNTVSSNLPPDLQSTCIVHRIHGLRTRVVRAMFHAYTPLSSRVHHAVHSQSTDPASLVGMRCVSAWYDYDEIASGSTSGAKQWRYYFRFEKGQRNRQTVCPLTPRNEDDDYEYDETDQLRAPDNVFFNLHEKSILLRAATNHFIRLPIVMGLTLVKGSFSGDGLFTHRLQLAFCRQYIHCGRGPGMPNGAVMTDIEPVTGISILHWWHPAFPLKH
jgi:hypothetical protein